MQTIHPDMNKDEADSLLAQFLNARKDERKEEKMGLERRLKVSLCLPLPPSPLPPFHSCLLLSPSLSSTHPSSHPIFLSLFSILPLAVCLSVFSLALSPACVSLLCRILCVQAPIFLHFPLFASAPSVGCLCLCVGVCRCVGRTCACQFVQCEDSRMCARERGFMHC